MGKRKKSCLNLHRIKRHNFRTGQHTNQAVTHSSSFQTSFATPQKSSKRLLTPISSIKKKKKSRSIKQSPLKATGIYVENVLDENILYDESSEEISEEHNDFLKIVTDSEVIDKLVECKLLHFFTLFFILVKRGQYPLKNIALLLWLETVKWYNCKSLQGMRFWTETKHFWRAGYRLFQGKFISFMSGPRSIGAYVMRNSNDRKLDPEDSNVNFAIPSRNFFIDNKTTNVPSSLKPGIIRPAIQSITTKVNMMCLDAKKVTAGLDKDFGDVDMFGHEPSPKLTDQHERLQKEELLVDDVKTLLSESGLSDQEYVNENEEFYQSKKSKAREIVDMLLAVLFILTIRLKDAKILNRKQEYGLHKLKERAGPEWKSSKYIFAISGIQAFLYRVKHFISRTLSNIDKISQLCSEINGVKYLQNSVNPHVQSNMLSLKPYEFQEKPVPTWFVKQRSEEWQDIRKESRVTGSTIHNAIGLRSLSLQKQHFDETVLGKNKPPPTEEVKKYMDHGTENEANGVATLVGKFLPVFHPDLVYVEEGCYHISATGGKRSSLLTVSPDGSLRKVIAHDDIHSVSECVAAIEIKCPFPKEHTETLYYSVPNYYICECLAEMKSMSVESMIFICYTKESSTFFEILYDENLWKLIQEEVEELYDDDNPFRPTKLRPVTKELKKEIEKFSERNVRLLVELPSVQIEKPIIRVETEQNDSPYIGDISHTTAETQTCLHETISELLVALTDTCDILQTGHQLSRKKANEVMVWVLSNKDRHWSAELPNSLIVAFGMKDYRLSSDLLREATDDVLRECKHHGLEVPLLAFDGQWYQLMVRDGDGKPLTKLQLQKDVWNEVSKMRKKTIVDILVSLNKAKLSDKGTAEYGIQIIKTGNGLFVESTDHAFKTIRTPSNPKHWKKTSTKDKEKDDNRNDVSARNETENVLSWVPDNVLEVIERSGDADLMNTLSTITQDINQLISSENTSTETPEETSVPIIDSEIPIPTVVLHDSDYAAIKSELEKSKRSEKWKSTTQSAIKEMLSAAEKITQFIKYELGVIMQTIITRHNITVEYKQNWSKNKLINTLCNVIANGTVLTPKRNIKKIPSLKKMAEKILRGKAIPKNILNIAYAQYQFPSRLEQWKSDSPVGPSCTLDVDNTDVHIDWYSYPEKNKATESILCKTLDSHHLLTNLRIRTSTVGLKDISPNAWKKVASSFKTNLTPAMVDDLTDKQSNSFAQTHFSREVEDEMMKNGDTNEAELCHIIRLWYEAEDQPAMAASERLLRWLDLREYLLKGVNFEVFPPLTGHIKGFSNIAFEGFLVGIDTKIQLYSICGPYCVRTASSLPAETAVGTIQDMNINKSMSVKAKDVPRIMSSLTEVMTYKLNPNRGFFMKTSRTLVYPTVEGDTDMKDNDFPVSPETQQVPPQGCKQVLQLEDHAFDKPERRRTKARRKLGVLTGDLDAPPKGIMPLRREFHKCDESKVLPSKRAGIFKTLENDF